MSSSDCAPSQQSQPYKSSIPAITVPPDGWKSNIPEHLLTGAEPQLSWIMHEISKNTQATEFACHGVAQLSEYLRELNGKTARTIENVAKQRDQLDELNKKAKTMEPFFKPVSQFAALWEYRVFRWVFYAAIFFFFTYLLPYYLRHPLGIDTLVKALFAP